MPITSIPVSGEFTAVQNVGQRANETAATGFAEHLKAFVKDVNAEVHHAEQISKDFADGKINSIHETMLAAEKANIAFKLVGTLRTKALEAYQEVMRMPI